MRRLTACISYFGPQFDSKPIEPYEADSNDVDESLTVPSRPEDDEDDPIIEYEDEFGRVRTGRRSEVPRHLLKEDEEEDIEYVLSPLKPLHH